jgi:hypothetical protein
MDAGAAFGVFLSICEPVLAIEMPQPSSISRTSKAGPSNANRRERVHESRQMQNNKTLG